MTPKEGVPASVPGTAAAREEHAELEQLRNRADQTAQDAAQTLGELTGRLAEAGNPRALARQAALRMRGRLDGHRRAVRMALAAVPALVLLAGAAIAYRQLSYRRVKS